MSKSRERQTFEFAYQSKMERANPSGITADYEKGELKGLVDMAYFLDIITADELGVFYKEIMDKYSFLNRMGQPLEKIK